MAAQPNKHSDTRTLSVLREHVSKMPKDSAFETLNGMIPSNEEIYNRLKKQEERIGLLEKMIKELVKDE